MTQIWVDITNASNVAYGDGPIDSATDWTQSTVLDKAGSFSFTMPATDPKAALLANRRYAHCYGVVDGAVAALGAGIIDRIEVVAGEPTMLRVTGPDLLAELGARVIPSLTVCGQELIDLVYDSDAGYWRGSARWISNRYGVTFDVDLPEAHDGVTASGGETITLWSEGDPNIEYLYVGCDARFDYVTVTISDTYLEKNRAETTLIGQYFDGTQWATLPDMVDGTKALEMGHYATMYQTGNITFTRPADWARVEPTAAAGSWFWVRFTVGAGEATDEFVLREVQVYADVPTTNGVNLIMAYAPDTWTQSGYDATTSAKYLEITNESVLSALRMLVEQGGQNGSNVPIREHFTFTSARALSWITTFSASGVRAVQATGMLPAGDGTCLIRSLRETTDTAETVTRLYPTSNDGITLALTTRTAPATYTLSTAGGYLQNDTGNSLYGQIDAALIFTDIQSQQSDSWYEHPMLVANALYDRALEYLRTHGTAQSFYDLEVVDAPATLAPGQTIGVVYQEYADAYHAVDIDATLYILGTRTAVDDLGLRTVGLDVATIDRLPETDAGAIVGVIRDTRRVSTGANTTILASVESETGGASFPGTIDFTTVNTDSGSEHFHYLDISTHTTNAAAHHAPVTVSNTGLSLSTQDLALNLAATSGLSIDAGLMIADTIAGNGLTISGKVMAVGEGNGLTVSADAIALTTPGTLTVATANNAAGNHLHAITSSSNPGAAAAILASTADGYLRLVRLGLGTAPGVPLHVAGATEQTRIEYNATNYLSVTVGSDGSTSITTATGASGGNLTLAPVGDVVFNPTNNNLLPSVGYDLNIGSLAKKYLTLHCAELWVETLVAQETIATIGGRILVGPTTELVADLAAASVQMRVKHNELRDEDRVFMQANGKTEFIRVFGRDITQAEQVTDRFRVLGDVSADFPAGTYFTIYGSTANDDEYHSDNVSFDGTETYIYVDTEIPDATADGHILYRGQQGGGNYQYWIQRSLDPSGANDWYAGDAVFNTGTVGDGHIDIYSVNGIYSPSSMGPAITGHVRASATFNDCPTIWSLGNLNGEYGYAATAYGAAFGRYANSSSFLTADATNGIRIRYKDGAGTETTLGQWDMSGNLALGQVATGKGNAYWNASNSRLEFRGSTDGTVVQAYIDTDGSLMAGAGAVGLDASGVGIQASTDDYADPNSVLFHNSGTEIGRLGSYISATNVYAGIKLPGYAARGSTIQFQAFSPTSYAGTVAILAKSGAGTEYALGFVASADGTGNISSNFSTFSHSGSLTVTGALIATGGLTGLRCPYQSELTLSAAGAITVGSGTFYTVDTYGDAASDELATIAGGVDGKIIILRTATNTRDVVVKNGTDNIVCGADLTLTGTADRIMLQYDGTTWYLLAFANNI